MLVIVVSECLTSPPAAPLCSFSRFAVQTTAGFHIRTIAALQDTQGVRRGYDYNHVYAVVDVQKGPLYTTTFGTISINGTANFSPIGTYDLSIYTEFQSMVFGNHAVSPYVFINAKRADNTEWFVAIDSETGKVWGEWLSIHPFVATKYIDLIWFQDF
jgi:hypothetical protein